MLVSERVLKWAMRFYPPLFFQRIWVQRIEKGFYGATVKINRSILNINYNRSIFGGSIYSAADAFYPVLYYQTLRKKGYSVKIWVKSSEIDFLRPGNSNLYLHLDITDEILEHICGVLNTSGKTVHTASAQIFDKQQKLCAVIKLHIYLRTVAATTNN